MNKEALHKLVAEKAPTVCQIVVCKNGEEIFSDEWLDYKKTDACHVMSITKSVIALLMGIVIDRGLIKSVDEKVLSFFPDYKVLEGEETIKDVTIKHMLTMTSPYKYAKESETKMRKSLDWATHALDLLGGEKGLTGEFLYSSVGCNILSGILANVTGETLVDFANKNLFAPLGITIHENRHTYTKEDYDEFLLTKTAQKTHGWLCDSKGLGCGGYGLCFSATDLAKLGQLCLDKGMHNGVQIVSAGWIEEMTKEHTIASPDHGSLPYGYLWWGLDKEQGIYAAKGHSGNVIYVNPTTGIVIGLTSHFDSSVHGRATFVQKEIEPFFID